MKKILYMLLVALCFTACDSDDDYTKEGFTSDVFDGEWLLCDENDPQTAMEISFMAKGYSYKSSTYINIASVPVLYDKANGFYSYLKSTNSLRILALSENSGMQRTYDFSVKSVSPYSMLLVNKSFNSYDVYSKIVKSVTIGIGAAIDNSYLSECGFSATEFVSINPNVASVDESGNITTNGSGTTYVLAKSGDDKIAVKVTVESMVTTYANLVYNATYSDIMTMYGEPDVTGSASETSVGLVYNNPSFDSTLKGIEIDIDLETEKVTRVLTIYKSESLYKSSVDFIQNNFYEVDFGGTYYCDADDFMYSIVHIKPFEKNGSFYISYGSTYFILQNQHY